MKNEKLLLTNNVSMDDLRNFCGDKVLFYTGDTRVITSQGNIHIDVGDSIVKNQDGSFTVIKENEQ